MLALRFTHAELDTANAAIHGFLRDQLGVSRP